MGSARRTDNGFSGRSSKRVDTRVKEGPGREATGTKGDTDRAASSTGLLNTEGQPPKGGFPKPPCAGLDPAVTEIRNRIGTRSSGESKGT